MTLKLVYSKPVPPPERIRQAWLDDEDNRLKPFGPVRIEERPMQNDRYCIQVYWIPGDPRRWERHWTVYWGGKEWVFDKEIME